jgi:tellurite resistance protein TerC
LRIALREAMQRTRHFMPGSAEIIEALPIILSLILIEGLLSVDNALAIAGMASHLPREQRYRALRYGLIGAYLFRGFALAGAHYIIENPWLKILGAAYLIHLMASHFADHHASEKPPHERKRKVPKGFWATVISIEVMDLSLSVDNVVAAVAMSPKLWVVVVGVFIGIIALRYVAGWCIRLIQRVPVLGHTAFLLIGYVGAILVVELTTRVHVSPFQKFIGICAIVAASVWYGRSEPVQRVLKPIVRFARWPLVAYAAVSEPLFGAIAFPFRRAARLFLKNAEQKCDAGARQNENA